MKNPWKKLSSKVVYKNSFFTVKENKVVRPDGKKGIYRMIHLDGGVAIVALTSKKEIYLVGQWRYTINKFSWSLPAGMVKKNRTFLKTAKDELEEEAGIKAKNWKYLGMNYESVGAMDQKVKYYLATDLIEVGQKLEGEEKGMKVIKIPLKKAVELIMRDKIFEGAAIIGIFKAIEYLKNNKLKL